MSDCIDFTSGSGISDKGGGVLSKAGIKPRLKSNNSANSFLDGKDLNYGISLKDARAFCRKLARSHYENFTIGSLFLPRPLSQHIYNIYAFSRYADDLADEGVSPAANLRRLSAWEQQLLQCYPGEPQHPIFVALADTIQTFDIPLQLFRDLLAAFRQDQTTTRYNSFADLLNYCRNSANPVGRIYLYLFRLTDPERFIFSDAICTALQLTNFWQDIVVDRRKGRVYLPQEDCARFGCREEDLDQQTTSADLRRLLQFEVERTQQLFDQGKTLLPMVPPQPRFEIRLFIRGGEAILEAIRQQQYDVLSHRPKLSKGLKVKLIVQTWWQNRIRGNDSI